MTWKSGKHGQRTGRTVRSSFSARNEGILVLKETFEDSESGAEIKTNEVVYSLGKQNRWLIPEMVKDSSNLRSALVDEDILFVERENGMDDRSKSTRRGDCMSVYDSASGHVWEPKGKYGQMDNLVERANNTRVVYEVTYPNNGTCQGPFNLNSQKSSRKKYHGKKRSQVRVDKSEWHQLSEDYILLDLEEDHFDVDYYDEEDSMNDHTMSLGDFICGPQKRVQVNSNPEINKPDNKRSDNEVLQSPSPPNNKVIVIEDEEMTSQHNKMYALSRKTDSLLRRIFWEPYYYSWVPVNHTKKTKYYRNILRKVHAEDEENSENKDEEPKPMNNEPCYVQYPSCEVSLWNKDLEISELKTTWGDMYLEGASYPRKFAISLSENCLSNIAGLSSAYILFELNCDGNKTTNHSRASLKLLLDSELSEVKMAEESTKLIIADFCNLAGKSSDVMEVKNVVEVAIACIKKHNKEKCTKCDTGHMNRTLSLNLYESILGWKGQCHTEKEALEEIKTEMLEKITKEVPLMSQSADPTTECGICFEDLSGKADNVFTTMNSCLHSFCNDCWKSYLETKLKSGQLDVLCPGHSCKTMVDLVTIMSVVPSLYGKYQAWKVKRAMASSPLWKNCPTDGCNFVCNVSACESGCNGVIPSYLPVSCHCRNIWCFNCQEQAHWPAPCVEAQKFRAENKGYAKAKKGRKLPEIVTAVSIKRCPNCSYPIEKFEGCSHMYCIMCDNSFCWYCLKVLKDDDDYYYDPCCDGKGVIPSTVMDIPFSTSIAQRLADLAVVSFHTVRYGIAVKTCRKLKSMEQGLEAYSSLKNLSKTFATSHTGSILENMIANNVMHALREAYCFEIQAHVALEGMQISLVSGANNKILHEHCTRLLFIVEKLTAILNNTDLLHKDKYVVKLNELIENGQKCLMDLGRHVERNPK